MLKIKTNKLKCESILKRCAIQPVSTFHNDTRSRLGSPTAPLLPPLEPAPGIRPVVNKHKTTKEKSAFKQTRELVELKSLL